AGEMRSIWVWIPHSLHDCEPAALEKLGCAGHCGMKPGAFIDLQKASRGQPKLAAMLGVAFVSKRHDRINAVVASVELDHDQHSPVLLRSSRTRRLCEKSRDR